MQSVLFICTGNYYRSRYAEALFNHHADRSRLGWRAFSRGMQIQLAPHLGFIAPAVTESLARQHIPFSRTSARPSAVSRLDFLHATRVIAMNEREHRPMMEDMFPDLADRIHYWHVGDIHETSQEEGMLVIESRVRVLCSRLALAGTRAWNPLWEKDPAETAPVSVSFKGNIPEVVAS